MSRPTLKKGQVWALEEDCRIDRATRVRTIVSLAGAYLTYEDQLGKAHTVTRDAMQRWIAKNRAQLVERSA